MKKLLLFLMLLQPLKAPAPPYSLDWHRIAGGGATSGNSQYSLAGTMGQHEAGALLTGGTYSLSGGFWAIVSVVQTAGAPVLYISHSAPTVVIRWQNVTGWALQQNENPRLSAGWLPSAGWTTVGGTNYLNVASPNGALFFRLHSQ